MLWKVPANEAASTFSPDGSTIAANMYALHTHASDHFAARVFDAATGTLLRLFGAGEALAAMSSDGQRLATTASSGYAIWCR